MQCLHVCNSCQTSIQNFKLEVLCLWISLSLLPWLQRGDPNQLLRIHGNKCKLHLDLSKGGVDTTMSVSLMEHSDQKTEWLRCSDICMKFNSLLIVVVPVTVTAYSCFDIGGLWSTWIKSRYTMLHCLILYLPFRIPWQGDTTNMISRYELTWETYHFHVQNCSRPIADVYLLHFLFFADTMYAFTWTIFQIILSCQITSECRRFELPFVCVKCESRYTYKICFLPKYFYFPVHC